MKGNVKFFNESKGYGFVAAEDGKEYFVHISGINEGVRLKDEDAVVFDVTDGDRGPKAVNVSLDDGSADDATEEVAEEAPEEESSEESTEEDSEDKEE